ncbi:alpha/beta hydrolase [Brevundimonas faecalis]|uniref:alpha/beta hydrolase n=1 Tax=Brevundimonas faecalis TaxID=947378 RepID=UPI00360C10FA
MGKALSPEATLTNERTAELEAAYNNRARVPGHPAVLDRWRKDSLRVIDALRPETLEYGPSERQKMEWFDAGAGAPVAVFMHGGYWQALDRGWFAWVAPALLEHGISVAVPGYDLAPAVSPGKIIGQMREATELVRARTGKRPLVFGHSVGGCMAACMLSEGRARAALAISGVFDLEPVTHTSLNDALGLDLLTARALSPIYWPVPNGSTPGGKALDCWVGGEESNEFVRQSRHMAAEWGGKGADTHVEIMEGLNHFTALDPLADKDSAMVRRLAALAVAE